MRLEIARWSRLSSRTALELIPCQLVRPTADYFRSGHLLLDSLTHSLLQHQAGAALLAASPATQPHVHLDARREAGPGSEPVTSALKGPSPLARPDRWARVKVSWLLCDLPS